MFGVDPMETGPTGSSVPMVWLATDPVTCALGMDRDEVTRPAAPVRVVTWFTPARIRSD
jgi:hypothetical protein